MVVWAQKLIAGRWFGPAVMAVIVLNAVLIGLETSPELMARAGFWLLKLNVLIQVAFAVELALRIAAHWPDLRRFFRDGWNLFDFLVVAVSLIPAVGPLATVVRLARILRVARVVSAIPELRLIIGTMFLSIPSIGHVILLIGLLIYIYGVLGYHLYAAIDPLHWGSLGRSCLTLFLMLTLEGWAELQATVMRERPSAWLFFGSFIVIAVFVVINLFIAVVLNNLERAREEQELARLSGDPNEAVLRRMHEVREQVDRLERDLKRMLSAPRREH